MTDRRRTALPAKIFAAVNVAWLLVLTVAFYSYWNEWPTTLERWNAFRLLRGHDPIGGVVPSFVLWAGALGGITISLVGCGKWSRDWDPKWNLWHALRPVMGLVSGSVGFVVVVLVLRTAAGSDSTLDQLPTNPLSQATFFMIAFLVGFRDRLFLELISKVTRTILTTGEEEEERPTFALSPDVVDFPDVPMGLEKDQLVRVQLTNPKATADLPEGWFEIVATKAGGDPDDFTATAAPTSGLSATYRDVVVTFKPSSAGAKTASLQMAIGDVVKEVKLAGRGMK